MSASEPGAVPGTPDDRSSGVLLHPTSLPTGKFGDGALRFIDWLAAAGQRWWQVLPLGPPDVHGSPYNSPSAFAGSPALLERPLARVSPSDLECFVAEQWYWAAGWARHSCQGALKDQVRFDREWGRVRQHANDRGIRILGDVPFYVAYGGADHGDHPEIFDDRYSAGVPPDTWSATGQLWGNPIYDWRAMARDRYRWWVQRFRRTSQLVDAMRIDHFRGFVSYWSVPRSCETAVSGAWRRGPGVELFNAVRNEIGPVPLVAENLGVITPAVERLRNHLGLPGAIVLQFEFNGASRSRAALADVEENVVYTGTHDNDTSVGWWMTATDAVRTAVDRALARQGLSDPSPNWKLIRLALHHSAKRSIVPAEDLLGLDSRARMNRPGVVEGNWQWRLRPGSLSVKLANRLREESENAQRIVTA